MKKRNLLFLTASVVGIAALYVLLQLLMPVRLSGPVEIRVPRGMSFSEAAELFEKQGLIKDRTVFILLGRVSGLHKKLKAGYYSFSGKINAWYVFRTMLKGYIVQYTVTVVEGDSIYEIRKKLASSNIMPEEDFDRLFRDPGLLAALGINSPSLEGYLYPDTYIFPKGLEPEEALRSMVQRLREMYDEGIRKRAEKLGMTENEALTLASIIEKEAFMDPERELISGVYHNRLKRRMPLQADPTCVYGIKPMSEGVKRRDLRSKTPYNTYIIKGLPPGPIASPGIKSIRAALYPADVPYIYFVSLGNGSHIFSSTMSEHERAIEYVRSRRMEIANSACAATNSNGL